MISVSEASNLPALRNALRSLPIILPLAPEAISSRVSVVLTDSMGSKTTFSMEAVSAGVVSWEVPS
jgi:hypothetical protein